MGQIHPKDRYIGMVFQNYALYPHFLSQGNLGFFFKMHKATTPRPRSGFASPEIMGIGFKELLPRKPGTLSGASNSGSPLPAPWCAIPAFSCSMSPSPTWTPSCAPRRASSQAAANRFKITALYVTHDQAEAITLGDQVAVMRAGRIEQAGVYQRLRHYPANTLSPVSWAARP